MGDNGSGNGGGNTSVYWEVVHGKRPNQKPPTPHNGPTPVPAGHVKVHNVVEGHSSDRFEDIGKPDHKDLFKVVLRYRDDLWSKVPPHEQEALLQLERIQGPKGPVVEHRGPNRFLTLHVPAIKRELPPENTEWGDQPWEIHWEW